MSPLERKETVDVPFADESEVESPEDSSDDEPIQFGLSAGDRALWKKVTADKDEFGFVRGQVVKELGRGAYVFVEDGKSREKIVNRDRLVSLEVPVNEVAETTETTEVVEEVSPRRSARLRMRMLRSLEDENA